MSHIDIPDEVIVYFEKRAKLAALLKEAGVKKTAREHVAEVLLDADVIDLDELDRLTEPREEKADLGAEWLDRWAWWNDVKGRITAVEEAEGAFPGRVLFRDGKGGDRWIPVSWVSHEPPLPPVA